MGAAVWVKGNIPLGDNEGMLVILLQSWEKPSAKEADAVKLTSGFLHHYPRCGGRIRAIKITKIKQVLFCEGCGLRLSIPDSLKTIKDLREYFKK